MAASKESILMTILILIFFVSANSHAIRNHQNSRKRQRAEVDIEALEAFKSSVTYDPFQALANWDLFNKVERRLQMWSIFMLHVDMKGVNWDLFNREVHIRPSCRLTCAIIFSFSLPEMDFRL
jgi:hypothetical protein